MFIFLDGISIDKVFHGYSYFIIVYAIILWMMKYIDFIVNNKYFNKKSIMRIGNSEKILLSIILLYFINTMRYLAEPLEGLRIISFLSIAYVNGFFMKKYNLLKHFLWIFFIISFIFILRQFVDAGMPFYQFNNLSNIFQQDRSRILFGFYHVNAAGNLAGCCVIVSFYLIYFIASLENKLIKSFLIIIVSIMDFIILSYLLDAASRTAILSILIWILFFIYYKSLNLKFITKKIKFIIRILVVLITIFVIFDSLGIVAYSFFVSSHRMSNFTGNLPLLNTAFKVLFGLGVSSPGTVAVYQPVDNYYLYMLLNFGLVGLLYVISILIFLGFHLNKLMNDDFENTYLFTFCIYICHIVAGMSETCVLYYLFPSSLIYWMLYFSCLNTNIRTIENRKKKLKIKKIRFKLIK